jgi:hypothetical protein
MFNFIFIHGAVTGYDFSDTQLWHIPLAVAQLRKCFLWVSSGWVENFT